MIPTVEMNNQRCAAAVTEKLSAPAASAPASGSEAALRAAARILAGSERGAIRWHGQREDGQWCWQYRKAGEIAAIIEEEMGKPLNAPGERPALETPAQRSQ